MGGIQSCRIAVHVNSIAIAALQVYVPQRDDKASGGWKPAGPPELHVIKVKGRGVVPPVAKTAIWAGAAAGGKNVHRALARENFGARSGDFAILHWKRNQPASSIRIAAEVTSVA